MLIVVCVDPSEMDTYADQRRRDAEHLMAIQSTAMATQNLLLAAHAEGLGACIMCAPLFCGDSVVSVLELSRPMGAADDCHSRMARRPARPAPHMQTIALIPCKALTEGKSRVSPALGAAKRAASTSFSGESILHVHWQAGEPQQ